MWSLLSKYLNNKNNLMFVSNFATEQQADDTQGFEENNN